MARALIVILCSCCSTAVFAQALYLKPTFSYMLPMSMGNSLHLDGYPYTGSGLVYPGSTVHTNSDASLAAGRYLGLSAGAFITDQLALELACTYGYETQSYTKEADISLYNTSKNYHTHIRQYMDRPLLLTPSIVWNRDPSYYSPYIRVGAVVPLRRSIYTEARSHSQGDYFFDKREYKTRLALGFSAALGYRVPLNRYLAINAEANLQIMSFKVDQAILLVSEANGEDVTDTREKSQKLVYYVDNYRLGRGSPDEPGKLPAYRIPFSGYGFAIGLDLLLN